MTKVVSFEKFMALRAAGLSDEDVRAMHHAPQLHSASESFVQAVANRRAGEHPRRD